MSTGKKNPTFDRKLVRIGGSIVVALPKEARTITGLNVGNKVRIIATAEGLLLVRIKPNYERIEA